MRATWRHVLVHALLVITAINVLTEEVSGTSDPNSKPQQPPNNETYCMCPRHWDPVCGQNNKTYHNPCLMKCNGQKKQHEGLCKKMNEQKESCPCPRHISLVCGANNKTYYNDCLMKCDGQTKKHKGACEAGSGEAGTWPWEDKSIQDKIKMKNQALDCVCGVPNQNGTQPEGRIAGGVEATPYKYGWMVFLESDFGNCGATILNDRMVLTAAHCVVDTRNPEDMSIKPEDRIGRSKDMWLKLNVHNRISDENAKAVRGVESVLVHPGFIPILLKGGWDYDIALLILKEPLVFPPLPQNGIRPICLPKLGEAVKTVGETARTLGWGRTDPDKPRSAAAKLQQLEVPITSLGVCRNVSKLEHPLDNFLCAGTLEVNKNPQPGDSGGPLQTKHGEQWTQVGIASWVEGYYFPDKDGTPDKIHKYAVLYTGLTTPVSLQYIYYHAHKLGVGWCKSTVPM